MRQQGGAYVVEQEAIVEQDKLDTEAKEEELQQQGFVEIDSYTSDTETQAWTAVDAEDNVNDSAYIVAAADKQACRKCGTEFSSKRSLLQHVFANTCTTPKRQRIRTRPSSPRQPYTSPDKGATYNIIDATPTTDTLRQASPRYTYARFIIQNEAGQDT
ncbi:hypothetical protein DL546_000586 [Coniochaeta pulveracea]|uniref:C2H2-type domain-containing protein n=1 Tax=Coniochaeta pulveracea TaxID=177199 RepID=A0A420Y0Z7_9PEZI|nr:hypothetical protein DL546_000586 [Coniochaeta pulveracea]